MDEERLLVRDQTKLVGIAKVFGPGNFVKLLKVLESILNKFLWSKPRAINSPA